MVNGTGAPSSSGNLDEQKSRRKINLINKCQRHKETNTQNGKMVSNLNPTSLRNGALLLAEKVRLAISPDSRTESEKWPNFPADGPGVALDGKS
jgi:hypothetical protein